MNFLVIVADGAHARLFMLPETVPAANESGPHLAEIESYVNPEQETPGHELWSDNTGGRSGGFDDHRARHLLEYEKRFATDVVRHAMEKIPGNGATRLIVAADNRMLGLLRDALAGKHGFELFDVAKDYCKLSPAALQAQLSEAGLIPPSRGPAA